VSEDPFIVVLTLAPAFVIISLVSSRIIYMRRLKVLRPLFMILLAPGIVAHEISHYLMCRALGVRVQKLQLLTVEKNWQLNGSVVPDQIQNSFFKPFLIATAPSLINTILACLLILIAPSFTEEWISILASWLVASLILGCGPSRSDLAFALRPITEYPKSTLKELGFLVIGILAGLMIYKISLLTIGVDLPPFMVAIFSFLTIVLACLVLREE
jgi:hypothetical protein